MKAINNLKYVLLSLLVVAVSSCGEDFLNTEPGEYISDQQISTSPAANQAILNGIYAGIRTFGAGNTTFHVDYGHMSTLNATEMMGQDVAMSAFHWFGFYNNYSGRDATSSRSRLLWVTYYGQIFSANKIINGIPLDTDNEEAAHILGQALTLRSLFYHTLVRLYGPAVSVNPTGKGVPIVDGTSFDGQPRATVDEVYNLIVADMENAVSLLEGFDRDSKQVINQNVANGILARIYLDLEEWQKAADAANAARQGFNLMSSDDYSFGFDELANVEVMWGSDIDNESTSIFASFFSHFDNTNNGYAGALAIYKIIDARLYDAIPDTDVRKTVFVDPVNGSEEYESLPGYANIKFVDATFFEGDYIYMRAAEMYLIEAEALARLNDATAADVLLDLVSTRDSEYTKSTSTGADLADEVYLQRRIELWGEGFSWFDLKRLNLPMIRDYTGTNHPEFAQMNFDAGAKEFLFQIPEDEINANEEIPFADQNL